MTRAATARVTASRAHVAASVAEQHAHVEANAPAASNQLRLRALGIQPKLEVSSPDDEYEREADRVADKVMRMPAEAAATMRISRVAAKAQRMCAECEEEEKGPEVSSPGDEYEREADRVADRVMRMPAGATTPLPVSRVAAAHAQRMCADCEEEEKGAVQRKEASTASPGRVPANPIPGAGAPLPLSVRAFFEPRFGRDLRDVRIHTGGEAAAVASSLRARAFTYGRDIVFGSGEYAPDTLAGSRVLAHELTHVAQQVRGPATIQRLGANAGCTTAEADQIHQAIYDARGWVNKALRKMETTPTPSAVLDSLRRNFGPTYGVEADIPLIAGRVRTAYGEMTNNPYSCAGTADAQCATGACGHSPAGGHASTICTNSTLAANDPVFSAGCVLHEALHAAFTNFTIDEYSGWHGRSSSTPTYPGTGTDPLLNADAYTTLVMDLS